MLTKSAHINRQTHADMGTDAERCRSFWSLLSVCLQIMRSVIPSDHANHGTVYIKMDASSLYLVLCFI